MSQQSAPEFSINEENKTITVKKEFQADLTRVWDAFTKAELLDQWWAPKPWKSETKEMDFREGGKRIYAMAGPEGEKHWAFMTFDKIEEHKRFSGKDGFSDENGTVNKDLPETLWEITFTGKNKSTLVSVNIQFQSLDDLETLTRMGFREGFSMAMQELDKILPRL